MISFPLVDMCIYDLEGVVCDYQCDVCKHKRNFIKVEEKVRLTCIYCGEDDMYDDYEDYCEHCGEQLLEEEVNEKHWLDKEVSGENGE